MTSAPPAASIIIVNWNGRRFLDDCLGSLRRQRCRDFEAIVVDNGSTDGSCEFVQARYPEAGLLELGRNSGFVAANWAGYEQARGTELIVLLNNDTEAAPDWAEAILEAAGRFPQAGSFASKMLYFDDRSRIDNCGFALTPAGATVNIGRDHRDGPAYSLSNWVFGGCGGAVAYRRAMLDEVGFLDKDIFMTYEDLDLSFRAQLRGWPCRFVAGARVYHHCHGTVPPRSARQVWCSQRHIELAYVKNMPASIVLRHLPERMLYEAGALLYFTRIGQLMPFCRAKLSALASLPRWVRARRPIQKSRKLAPSQLPLTPARGWIKQRVRKALALE